MTDHERMAKRHTVKKKEGLEKTTLDVGETLVWVPLAGHWGDT